MGLGAARDGLGEHDTEGNFRDKLQVILPEGMVFPGEGAPGKEPPGSTGTATTGGILVWEPRVCHGYHG